MSVNGLKSVHFVGIGGISMSAVAKLLLATGVRVSGSDVAENEQTNALKERGAHLKIGHAGEHVPMDAELVIYNSAVPVSNSERLEAMRRGIPEMTNFEFLGEWTNEKKTILITGTHGKSTTTAMLGLMLEKAGFDPTVFVGSKVPSFAEGNVRLGSSDVFVIEGDEYAKHFLEFHPYGVVLNNIELDHTDIFPTIQDVRDAFLTLLKQVQDGGVVIANVGSLNVLHVLDEAADELKRRSIRVIRFNGNGEDAWRVTQAQNDGVSFVAVEKAKIGYRFELSVPGMFNALNATGASLMARELSVEYPDIAGALASFTGIWRRFEWIGSIDGARVYSDYGHHPTAVTSTLAAAKEMFPSARIVLCFQPHHRNRTKHLFLDFVPSFDFADVLVLCEIYDVAGRESVEDEDISSRDLVDAVIRHDADRGVPRLVEFARTPEEAVGLTLERLQKGDVVIFMGAGDIDAAVRRSLLDGNS